jgi:hypothetical protein
MRSVSSAVSTRQTPDNDNRWIENLNDAIRMELLRA